MPHICPKSCGRLCTAAILISVGVVQLIAGLILVKSKYAYLLSAPDFWTAASNFAVGGMLGVSASVWKETGRMSPKHATRRNILVSLMFSCLMINATTAAILILGEGNALLSIQLESNGLYSSSALTSELLAYAYATSVCSPIICIVISCVYMSGLCFRRKGTSIETTKTKKVLDEADLYTYNWVYNPKLRDPPQPDPEIVQRALSRKYLSSSSDDDSSSDSLHSCRSNSVPSVEDLDVSLQHVTKRIRTRSESDQFHQQQPDQELTVGTEGRSLPRIGNRVSFVDESSKDRKSSREMLLSLPQHSSRRSKNGRDHSNLESHRLEIENIPATEHMSMRNSKHKIKAETSFKNSDFEDIEMYNEGQTNRFGHRIPLKQNIPTDYYPIPRKSIITADVHLDARKLKSDQGYTNRSFSPEESTLVYEVGASSKDTFGRNNDNCYTDRRIHRTSTARSLMSEAMDQTRNDHRTVHRTFNTRISNQPDEFSVVEDWNYNVSKLDQRKSSKDTIPQKSSFNKISHSSVKRQHEEPKMADASAEIVDASFDTSQIDFLAGEVVPIQVSTLPRKLSSKLIPVTIPAVSGSRKYSLKASETSGTNKFRNITENPRHGTSLVRTSKFECNGEPKLLSFHGAIKTKEFRNRKTKNSPPPISNPEPSTSHYADYRARHNCPPSPTHTSGYLSALEETLDSTGKSRSAETSVLSLSTGQSPQKKHWTSSGHASQDTWESSEMVKEMVTQIIEESPEMHSKKELIDQLLKDPAFQKMVKQTLKETEI